MQFSQVNIDEPMFQPFPSEIYFQNFEPYEVYEVPLILRNNDKVSTAPHPSHPSPSTPSLHLITRAVSNNSELVQESSSQELI